MDAQTTAPEQEWDLRADYDYNLGKRASFNNVMRLWGLVPLINLYLSGYSLLNAATYDGATTEITNVSWEIWEGSFWLDVYNSFISYFKKARKICSYF